MSLPSDPSARVRPSAPPIPALAVGVTSAAVAHGDGEIELLSREDAARRLQGGPHIVCHAPFTLKRVGLGRDAAPLFDVLELFGFVYPARLIVPSPRGLARALGHDEPQGIEDEAIALQAATATLIETMAARRFHQPEQAQSLALAMERANWPWAHAVLDALGPPEKAGGFDAWTHLREWEERAPRGEPSAHGVSPNEARERLADLLGDGRERRTAQSDYAAAVSRAFAPREAPGQGHVVLAEAGTGVGKTMGYIAPASLWAERNDGAVWISTYTKNLQRQIDQELMRLYPDPAERAERVVIRKGRENYLCLLNYQESVGRAALTGGRETIFLALVARWIAATRDGDFTGGDFPAWLFAREPAAFGLTDRRGECTYAACPHYRRCFIERNVRAAGNATIVVANHALVMSRAALRARSLDDHDEEDDEAERIVFDEGHHLFDAADGIFASHLTGLEGAELRRWIRGRETGARASRIRGLRERLSNLIEDQPHLSETLDAASRAAGLLPGDGWQGRVADGRPRGPFEALLVAIRIQVLARAGRGDADYGLECTVLPLAPGVAEAAGDLARALRAIAEPLGELALGLQKKLADEAAELDAGEKARLRALSHGLERRARLTLPAWRRMLDGIAVATPETSVDWFGIERDSQREIDLGFYRHWIDPTLPFAEEALKPAPGALITSATLRDRPPDDEMAADFDTDWRRAELRTGASHLAMPAIRAAFDSPFDYAAATRIFVVADVPGDDPDAVAAAYRELFLAAGGGALGLFTAVRRLKAVHARLAAPLEAAGLPLYAQHVDALDPGTLVDIFRAEADSCLLGTDALRDGVDVPGRSLRLVVFDRVPWPRPDILHKARRAHFGKRYDDMIVRMRLKQAFGRLIRRADDKGVFVSLDVRTPTRLLTAFPPAAPVERCDLKTAVRSVRAFLHG